MWESLLSLCKEGHWSTRGGIHGDPKARAPQRKKGIASPGEFSLYLQNCTLSIELGLEVRKINSVIKTESELSLGLLTQSKIDGLLQEVSRMKYLSPISRGALRGLQRASHLVHVLWVWGDTGPHSLFCKEHGRKQQVIGVWK